MFLSKEISELYNNFASAVYQPRILDGKTKELIALACSVMADCVPCIDYHYKMAVAAGATKEEISEALAITMSVRAGSKGVKYADLIDELGK